MASRIVHLAIANEIIKAHPLPEPERFLFGSLLPDAHPDKSAHYNKYLRNGQRKTHDLTGFRRRFVQIRQRHVVMPAAVGAQQNGSLALSFPFGDGGREQLKTATPVNRACEER